MNWKVVVLDPESLIREIRKALKDGDLCVASSVAYHLSIVLQSMSEEKRENTD